MDYPTLVGGITTVGSVQYWINWSRIDSVGIVAEAQAWIYSKLRVKQMTATADVPIALSATFVAYPTGYLDPIQFGIPGYINRIKYRDAERFRSLLAWDTGALLPVAPPTAYSDFDNALQLNTKSDAAYTAKMVYYRSPAALSVANPTNFLTDRYPTLLRRACLMFASEERKEPGIRQELEVLLLQMIGDIKVEGDLSMRGMELDFGWGATDEDDYS